MNKFFSVIASMLFLLSYSKLYSQTPVNINGQLQVLGTQLCNEDGYPVQLRGMSSHGLQWYGDCINATTIGQLKSDWGADVIRLAMYVDENGSGYLPGSAEQWKATVKTKVDMVIAAGLYCIIDWHVHNPGDPLRYVTEAVDFFDYFSELYAGVPNVIFEICNEPNKVGSNNDQWEDNMWSLHIKPYAEQVIPVIRANYPEAVILVGTPIWSSKPGDIIEDPLTGNNAEDVLYSFHFYGGSHYTQSYINQYSDKIPIFMNEWGTSINKGNYGNDYINTQAWFDLMAGNNPGKQLMSWCNWSLCDKTESSAALAPGACNSNVNLTSESGAFVKADMQVSDNFIASPVTKPRFAVQPFSQLIIEGTSAYVRSKAVGPGVMQYQWYKDGAVLQGATESDLIIKNFGSAQEGMYKVKATNHMGSAMSRTIELTLDVQAPQGGIPWSIPGVVEVEDYDSGGDGVSYNDLKHPDASEAGSFGSPPVEPIYITSGDGTNDALGGLGYNDWIEFTVNFSQSGYYTFIAHAYSEENAPEIPQFWVALDNVKITKIKDIPTSAEWTDTYSDTVWVEQGTYVMQVLIEERLGRNSFNSFKLDYINVVKLNIDCNGVEDGTASIDECGICSGGTTGISPAVDSDNDGVFDCDDNCPNDPDKTEPGVCGCGVADGTCDDCDGVYGGTATIDDCDVCSGGDTGIEPNSTCTDCSGEINGTAQIDNCGVCSGGNTGIAPDETCTDCAGILNGTAFVDDCGVCVGGSTGLIENESCSDCLGVPNGTAEADVCGECNGDGTSCTGTLTPYKGENLPVPGKIEAEYFCAGGEGVAYHDNDATNSGNVFRTEDGVDVATEGTGLCIGWIDTDEWVKYYIEVLYTDEYTLEFYCGGMGDGKTMTIEIGTLSFDVDVVNTNSYSLMDTVVVNNIALAAGVYEMTVTFNSYGFNLDYIDFIPQTTPDCAGVPGGTAYKDDCGVCIGGTTGLSPTPDSDNDGVLDCSDLCPKDPNKVVPGNCGCGVAEGECPDCNGDIGGTATIDECNVCSGGNTGVEPNSTCIDCNGEVNGIASVDDCGVCSGGSTGITPNATCIDCNGVLNGSAEIDGCGVCAGGTTGVVPDESCPCPGEGGDPDECGICGGDGSTCADVQLPYLGITRNIPGVIQAEDFDTGGEGLGYHDSDASHNGSSSYRTSGVDLDNEGNDNHSIAYITDGEYVNYTITVLYTGDYTVKLGLSTPNDGNSVDLLFNEVLFADDLPVPNTGSYHSFSYAEVTGISLEAGTYEMRILLNGEGYNFDDIVFEPEFNVDCNGVIDGTAYIDACGICVGGTTTLEECTAMQLDLGAGWNLVSFYVSPANADVASVFAAVSTDLSIVKNSKGFYMPQLDVAFKTLDNIELGDGYLVYMNAGNTLAISGATTTQKNIALKAGWNLIGYPLDASQEISNAVSSISDKIVVIKNFDGFWEPGGLNSVTEFIPGKGYFIKVSADCTLSF